MKKKMLILCCCFLGLGTATIFAQQGNPAAGGNASGTGGSASFSIGQVFYVTGSSTAYNVVPGLQQPFEISVVNSLKEQLGINLFASVFPNPSVDKFTLKVEAFGQKNLTCNLYDMSGRLIQTKKIEALETSIEAEHLVNAQYLLKVFEGEQEVKTFKIVKIY